MMRFIDLQRQHARIEKEVEEAVGAVLRGGQYIHGPEVERLEGQLAGFTGATHCVSCASGTDALVIALMAKGIGRGDLVFTTPFTFMASAEAISLVGATPVFVDVDPITYNIDPKALRGAIASLRGGGMTGQALPRITGALGDLTPKAIIAVDLFGLPADYRALDFIAREHGLTLIEDAAQSFGGTLGNERCGALAEIACTSFFPAKPLGCYGDGGALFTDDEALDAIFRSVRVHGQGTDRYEHVRLGLTGRMDTIQAAVLLVKLGIFEDELAKRQAVADSYTEAIRAARVDLVTPVIPDGYTSAWAQYSVLARDAAHRAELQKMLGDAGIPTAIYYPKPLHLQVAFAALGYREGDFPISEDLAGRIFALPMHPYLAQQDVDRIATALSGTKQ